MNAVNIGEIFPRHDKITRRRVRPIEQRAETAHAAAVELQRGIRARAYPLCERLRVRVDQTRSELFEIALDVAAIAKIASLINLQYADHIERLRARILKRIERVRAMDPFPNVWTLRLQLSEIDLDVNDLVACAWTHPEEEA